MSQSIEMLLENATTRHILETAHSLFLTQGYAQVEMKDVAARCGISRSTLYRHFPSKEVLAFYVSMYLFQVEPLFYRGPLPEGTGWERLAFYVRRSVELMDHHRAQLAYLTQFDSAFSGSYPDEVAADYEHYVRDNEHPLLTLLQDGMADGSIRPLENPGLTAAVLGNALLAMAQRVLPREEHFRREQGHGAELLVELAEELVGSYRNIK